MARYIVRRLLQIPMTLVVVSLIVFSIVHVTPGDPVQLIAGDFATAEDEALLRRQLGLDKPIHHQYLSWMTEVVTGDLGTSLYTGKSARTMILDRAPYTITLALLATLIAVAFALPLGVVSAKFNNRPIDQVVMFVSTLGMALPTFVVAIVWIMIFAITLKLVPIAGPGDPIGDPLGSVKYYIIPVASLTFVQVAQFTRIVRSSMLDVLSQDYIRVARAKGLSERNVILMHALKNAFIPIITVVALSFAHALGGTVVIESIFSIPGIGLLMLDAIVWRDFPLIQGITLVLACVYIVVNLVADLLYGIADPRIHYE